MDSIFIRAYIARGFVLPTFSPAQVEKLEWMSRLEAQDPSTRYGVRGGVVPYDTELVMRHIMTSHEPSLIICHKDDLKRWICGPPYIIKPSILILDAQTDASAVCVEKYDAAVATYDFVNYIRRQNNLSHVIFTTAWKRLVCSDLPVIAYTLFDSLLTIRSEYRWIVNHTPFDNKYSPAMRAYLRFIGYEGASTPARWKEIPNNVKEQHMKTISIDVQPLFIPVEEQDHYEVIDEYRRGDRNPRRPKGSLTHAFVYAATLTKKHKLV